MFVKVWNEQDLTVHSDLTVYSDLKIDKMWQNNNIRLFTNEHHLYIIIGIILFILQYESYCLFYNILFKKL